MFAHLFDRVYVINLARRPDRWQNFQRRLPVDWAFREPVRVDAIDGQLAPPPDWWKGGQGAWGCYRSHLAVLEECLNQNVAAVMLIEDDASFAENFSEKAERFFTNLPDDWSFVYLGGQHIEQGHRLPRKVNDWVYIPFNVNRTHCFALRGRPAIEMVYRHLNSLFSWTTDHHIDHHLGELHKRIDTGLYVPREWLVAQNGGQSNVNGKHWPEMAFRGAEELTNPKIDLQMVAVAGTFRAGTSCVAGVLHTLGVNMGAKFPDPDAANSKGYFEAERLANICRMAFREPWMTEEMFSEDRVNLLRRWAADRCAHLGSTARFAGGKHPSLCLLGSDLLDAWNDPHFIVVDRPVDESIESVIRAGWDWPEQAVRYALPRMLDERDAFLRKHGPRQLRVPFHRILRQPAEVVAEICDFLGLDAAPERRRAAADFVDTSRVSRTRVA